MVSLPQNRLMLGIWLLIVIYTAVSLSLPRGSQSLLTFGNWSVYRPVAATRVAPECWHAPTGEELFWMLIALKLHSLDDWAVPMDLLEVYLHKSLPDLYPGDIFCSFCGVFPSWRPLALLRIAGAENSACVLATWIFALAADVVGHFSISSPCCRGSTRRPQWGRTITIQRRYKCSKHGCRRWIRCSRAADPRRLADGLATSSVLPLSTCFFADARLASDVKDYYTGSLYDLPLISSFLWFGMAGVIAYQLREKP